MRRWTDDTDAEAATYYRTLSTAEIRKRQTLTQEQLGMAYEKELPDAMADLRRQEDALTREMLRRSGHVQLWE